MLRFVWVLLIPLVLFGFVVLADARRGDGGLTEHGGIVSVLDLGVGDCFDATDATTIAQVTGRPCSEAHEYEIVAVVFYPFERGIEYPGIDALIAYVGPMCERAFEDYVGIPLGESVYWIQLMTPSPDGWEGGDRESVCLAYHPGRADLEGTIRGSGK